VRILFYFYLCSNLCLFGATFYFCGNFSIFAATLSLQQLFSLQQLLFICGKLKKIAVSFFIIQQLEFVCRNSFKIAAILKFAAEIV